VNVLITSAGRRNYLVSYFRDALRGRGRILAADMSPLAPALAEADAAHVVPPASDTDHVDALLELCREQDVRLLVSVNDAELLALAESRAAFAAVGTRVLVSSPAVVRSCQDKLEMNIELARHGIDSPHSVVVPAEGSVDDLLDGLEFPLVVKHRHGRASSGFLVVHDHAELEAAVALARYQGSRAMDGSWGNATAELIVQAYVPGEEFGLDIMNDLEGRYVATAVKRKLSMRAGETERAITVADAGLEALGARIGQALGHVGMLDCDVMVYAGRRYVLDLNPRFGGGYPFSHLAGVDMPSAILAWLNGESPDPRWFVCRAGVAAAKYDLLMPGRRARAT
jgi:carbamoyl-phosphate synthase large subunit